MRANNRVVNYTVDLESNKSTIFRYAYFKEGIIAIDTYEFDGNTENIETVPVSHEIRVLNGQGKIIVYEVNDLLYTGETIKDISSPQSFGHNMKIEWEDGNYYSRIWKYAGKDVGKLEVKYRPDSDDYSKNVRLFDPPKFKKTYNENDRRLIIEDNSEEVILDIRLSSPNKVLVGQGNDVKVAEFYLSDVSGSLDKIFDSVNFYEVDKDYAKKQKDYWFKYGVDYVVYECFPEFEKEVCDYNVKINWTRFDSLKELPNKNIKIGLFTNTMGEKKVEWIPNIKGFDILEWASYEIVGLATYFDNSGDYSVRSVESIAVSPDGNYLFTSSQADDRVSIMNITNKSIIVPLSTYYDAVGEYSVDGIRSLAISSDGNYLATSSQIDDYVSIMNITDKTQIVPLSTYYDAVGEYSVEDIYSLAISSDGNYLFTSSATDSYVSIMNITDKTQIVPLATYYDIEGDYSVDYINSIAVSPDGNYLATSSYLDDRVSIMNITDKTQIVPLSTYYDAVGEYSVDGIYSLAISSDGNYLATSSQIDDYVSIMNITDKNAIVPLSTYNNSDGDYSVDGIRSIFVFSDGNYLFTSSVTDSYVSIMQFREIVVEDTCTYTNGNWNILFSDYCNITSNVAASAGTNNLTITGIGIFTTTANITGFKNVRFSGTAGQSTVRCLNAGCFK